MEDLIEDMSALSSDEYLRSIEEARTDYKDGKVKYLEEIFDVGGSAYQKGVERPGEH